MNRKTKFLVKAACDYLDAEEIAAFRMVKPVSPPRSPEYMEKIKQLFARFDETPKKSISHRAKIGLLIAAALLVALLTACAVFHEQIGNFFVDRKTDRLEITSSTGARFVETRYCPTYIPVDFEIDQVISIQTMHKMIWTRESDTIIFRQTGLKGSISSIDSESLDSGTKILGGTEVLYTQLDGYFSCLWEDGNYSYFLMYPASLPDEEIERIILSITEYTPDTKP